jgi:hypothetical protein
MSEHKVDEIDGLIGFLGIAEKQGFLNANTAQGRRTACTKLLSVLDADQRTVGYVRDHLDVIKTRFQHLNSEVRGQTIEEYGRRVAIVVDDFTKWSTDKAAWEKGVGAKGVRSNGDSGENRARPGKTKVGAAETRESGDMRSVKVPLSPEIEVTITVPRELKVSHLKRILWALLPYAGDWDPDAKSPQQVFPMLEDRDDGRP